MGKYSTTVTKYKGLQSFGEVCWQKQCVHGYFDGVNATILLVNVQIIAIKIQDICHKEEQRAMDTFCGQISAYSTSNLIFLRK